jgi:hypothetical protein
MTISVLVDIFYVPNSGYFGKIGVFQQPLSISLIMPLPGVLSEMARLCQLTKKRSSNALRPSVNIAETEIEGTEDQRR